MNTSFSSFLTFEQVESDMAKNRQIFSGMIFPNPAFIFSESDVQNPVELILDFPMTTLDSTAKRVATLVKTEKI